MSDIKDLWRQIDREFDADDSIDVDEYFKKFKDGSWRELIPHFISTNTDVSSE